MRPFFALFAALLIASFSGACEEILDNNPTLYRSPNKRFTLSVDRLRMQITLKEAGKVRWQTGLVQGGVPSEAFVSDDGRRVVLLGSNSTCFITAMEMDLAVLDEKGAVLAGYDDGLRRLTDTSHLRYAEGRDDLGPQYRQSDLYVPDSGLFSPDGGQLWFIRGEHVDLGDSEGFEYKPTALDLQTGQILAVSEQLENELRGRFRKLIATKLSSDQWWDQATALGYVAATKDKTFLPQIQKLLNDPTVTNYGYSNGRRLDRAHGIQTAAGLALATVSGKEAIPTLMQKLRASKSSPSDRANWITALSAAGSPPDEATIEEMASSREPNLRSEILMNLKRTDPTRARALALRMIDDPKPMVRYEATEVLSASLVPKDVPLLVGKLQDKDLDFWAMRSLMKLRPKGLREILARVAKSGRQELRFEANLDLARMGDKKAQQMAVRWLATSTAKPDPSGNALIPIGIVANTIADTNPPGAKEVLRRAAKVSETAWDWDIHVRGALAQLGEREHLAYLRDKAKDGPHVASYYYSLDAYRRAAAIEWLGNARDQDSVSFLRELSHDRDRTVRGAALHALEQLGATSEPTPPARVPQRFPNSPSLKQNASAAAAWPFVAGAVLLMGAGAFLARRRK